MRFRIVSALVVFISIESSNKFPSNTNDEQQTTFLL